MSTAKKIDLGFGYPLNQLCINANNQLWVEPQKTLAVKVQEMAKLFNK